MSIIVKKIESAELFEYKFSICSLVSKHDEYKEMIDSFLLAGFDPETCEYICIDNSNYNSFDAYNGLNRLLRSSKGEYIILCHQDILLHDDNRNKLESLIEEMNTKDPMWGILSNAGGINLKYRAVNITQNSGHRSIEPHLPLKTMTVDENFIIAKNEANLALSADLNGFHLYGADICLIADILGYNSYIIDFNLIHKSNGTVDNSFWESKKNMLAKYNRALRSRFLSTTVTRLYIAGNKLQFLLFNIPVILRLMRQYYKLFVKKNYRL